MSVACTGFFLSPFLPKVGTTPAVTAGGGGSQLPWWSPLAASFLLLVIAAIYRLRTRPFRGGSSGAPPSLPEETVEPGPLATDSRKDDPLSPMFAPLGI
jgi:hypothetical protein